MNLVLTVIPPNGAIQSQAVEAGGLKISAVAGMTYRVVDLENPDVVIPATVRKVGDDMVIDLIAGKTTIVIQDYYFICRFDYRSCYLDLDTLGGGAQSQLAADQNLPPENVDADDTVLVWQTGSASPVPQITSNAPAQTSTGALASESTGSAAGVAPAAGGEGIGQVGLIGGIAVGLGVFALAAGGSGGGGAVGSDPTDDGSGVVGSDPTDDGSGVVGSDPTDDGGGVVGSDPTDGDNNGGDPVDNVPPASPTVNLTEAFQNSRPIISGTAEPGSTINLSINVGGSGSLLSYQTTTDAAGSWAVDLSIASPLSGTVPTNGLPADVNSPVQVVATDAAGNISAPTAAAIDILGPVVGRSVTVDQVVSDEAAPVDENGNPLTAPGIVVGPGVVANNGQTNDSSPLVSGRVDAPLAANAVVVVLRNG
ncbi:MAG: hypothetical protein WBD13_04065, partial [Burkholderiaceae bacterium]